MENEIMRSNNKTAERTALGKGLCNIAMRRTPVTANPAGVLCSDWETNKDRALSDEFKV